MHKYCFTHIICCVPSLVDTFHGSLTTAKLNVCIYNTPVCIGLWCFRTHHRRRKILQVRGGQEGGPGDTIARKAHVNILTTPTFRSNHAHLGINEMFVTSRQGVLGCRMSSKSSRAYFEGINEDDSWSGLCLCWSVYWQAISCALWPVSPQVH